MKIAFVFTHSPYSNSRSREGLDTLLAMAAYCDEDQIGIFFLNDAILNLLPNQKPTQILQKDTASMFKLLDLYELEQRFICQQDLARYQLKPQDLQLSCQILEQQQLFEKLHQAEKILTF